jgi:DNA-directed RNA polymerase
MMDLQAIQVELEEEMFNGGITRFESAQQRHLDAGNASDAAWNRRLISQFIEPLAAGIQAFKEESESKPGVRAVSLPFLQCCENEVAAYITMKVVMDMLHSDSSYQHIAITIGERIEDQVRFTKLDSQAEKYMEKVKKNLERSRSKLYKHKHRVMVAAEKSLADKAAPQDDDKVTRWESWTKEIHLQVGQTLMAAMEGSVFYNGEPVFFRYVASAGGKKQITKLQTSESIGAWVHEFREHVAQLAPAYGPCVVPPRDWKTPFNGGFHTEKVASRIRMVKGPREHVRKLTIKQMPMVYKAVNALQRVEWVINTKVLDVAQEVVRLNLGYGVPSFQPIIDRDNKPGNPVPVEFQDLRGAELKAALTPEQWDSFLSWKSECARLYTAETKRGSKSAAVARMLGQARKYAQFPHIYFVYTLDSRSRVYAQSSTLSPQSNDLGKSLLRFKEGRQLLTVEDLRWFLVCGANLWGWDKKTFDVRVSNAMAEEFQEMCRDIASDPLTFTQWVKADEPYEFLAWAFEYAEYLDKVEEGRSDEFYTHLPVHQDGSCSGIQHYSAMLRDSVGAAAVNLKPSDSPQDIYGRVAEVVIEKNNAAISAPDGTIFKSGSVELDAEQLREMGRSWLSIGITRSLTKKPVMTLPYGSTRITCREAVADYLADLEEKEAKAAAQEQRGINPVHPFGGDSYITEGQALNYMTALIWPSISEVVKAPVVAMKMIRSLARAAARRNEALEYPLPTGFILYQKIMSTDLLRVRTQLLGMINMYLSVETDIVDEAAMMGAAAPNFVHGHDASHLIMTVCDLVDKGVTSIAVIHDSFGTHAPRTADLRDSLKGQMIAMYQDRHALADLVAVHEERWLCDLGITVPELGDFDLNEIMDSEYVFA